MTALLWFAAVGVIVANLCALFFGDARSISGMLMIDALLAGLLFLATVAWTVKRAAPAAGKASQRAAGTLHDGAADAAAHGLRATRRASVAIHRFADKVRARAGDQQE